MSDTVPSSAEFPTARPPRSTSEDAGDSYPAWIRGGIGLAALGNAINCVYTLGLLTNLNADRWREIIATLITGGAWLFCRRNPPLATMATVAAVWMELSIALMQSGQVMDEVLAVFPLLGLVAGLFWGARGAVTLAIANSVAIPVAIYLGGRWGDDFSQFTASDGHVLLVELVVIVSTAIVTTIGLRTLRRLNSELEARVTQRTRELSERVAEVETLAQALKEANGNLLAANEDLEAFSYSVSHDLRAPLRNVTGFLELLSLRTPGELEPERARVVAIVQNETKRMGRLIDDLLALARLGRSEMQMQSVDLAQLVATVREELKSDVGERSVQWQVGPLPNVRGDPALLRQVFANLLGNSVKFTRCRTVARIEIGENLRPPGETMITLFVRDNGAGFNPKYRDKLFGVFQRLHHARDFEGTGIGLANVKRIISRHGGRVWAEGQVDQGATFYFTIMAPLPEPSI